MISDPILVRYACVAHKGGGGSATILAEYNPGDSSVQALAQECLHRTPPNHLIFSHTIQSCAYTFLIDDPLVYFGIFDDRLPKSDRIWLLSRLKDAAQHLIAKHRKSILKSSRSLSSYCFQSQMNPILGQLLSNNGVDGVSGSDQEANGLKMNGASRGIGCKSQSKEKRIFAVPLLVKMGEGFKKKKILLGESGCGESNEMLVDDNVELSDQGEATSIEVLVGHQRGACAGGEVTSRGLCLGDVSAGKQKAKRIWRKHVWVVLALDLAVCMILFGVWLMVCHGFECING